MYESLGIDLGASGIVVGAVEAGIIASEPLPHDTSGAAAASLGIGIGAGQHIARRGGGATRCRALRDRPLVSEVTSKIIRNMLDT